MVPLIVMFGVIGIGVVLGDLLHHRKKQVGHQSRRRFLSAQQYISPDSKA